MAPAPSTGSSRVATVGAAMKPRTSDVTVMPSCAPERWNDRRCSTALRARGPLVARRGPRCRAIAVDGDERELGGDEEGRGHHQRQYGEQPECGSDGLNLEPRRWA